MFVVRACVILSTCLCVWCVCVRARVRVRACVRVRCVCMRMWVVVSRVCVQFVCLFGLVGASELSRGFCSVWFILQGEVDNTLMTDELADGDGGIFHPSNPIA